MAPNKKKTVAVIDEPAHAEFSASGSSRWINCPGSISLSKLAPEPPDSEYALDGTKAHECLEFLLNNRTKLKSAEKMAKKTHGEEKVEHAMSAVSWVNAEMIESPDATLLVETKVDASSFTCAGQFGTLDIAIVRPFGKLTIADFKYGAGVSVDPAGYDGRGNPQLVYYALGISVLYDHNFAEVELVVIQPRAYHESGETIRSFTMPMTEFLKWREVFKKGVAVAKAKDPIFNSGEWCRFCPAAVMCPELKARAMKQAQIVFSDEQGVESVPEPKMISLPNLGTILEGCEKLEAWIGKVREHAEHVLKTGGEVEGFKLVEKRGQRKWTDEELITDEAVSKFGQLALTQPKLLSPAQLEKAAKGTKGVDEWVAERVTTKSSGSTLVKESDPRPSLRPISEVFAIPATPVKTIVRKAKK